MKVKPTKDGIALEKVVSPIMSGFESLKKNFEGLKDPAGVAEIRIATHEAVMTYFLPDYVEQFQKKNPKIKFTFFRLSKAEIISAVLNGEADFGITTLDRTPHGIIYQRFATYGRVLICPKGHPLSKFKQVTLKDIVKYPLILPPMHSETRNIVDQVFKKKGLSYSLAMELAAREAVKIYVKKGFGISILNDYYLFPEDKKILTEINVSKDFGTTERGILYRKGKSFSALQQAFIDQILKLSQR
jgi:DNA-binding transcriptional LysR family regulator